MTARERWRRLSKEERTSVFKMLPRAAWNWMYLDSYKERQRLLHIAPGSELIEYIDILQTEVSSHV